MVHQRRASHCGWSTCSKQNSKNRCICSGTWSFYPEDICSLVNSSKKKLKTLIFFFDKHWWVLHPRIKFRDKMTFMEVWQNTDAPKDYCWKHFGVSFFFSRPPWISFHQKKLYIVETFINIYHKKIQNVFNFLLFLYDCSRGSMCGRGQNSTFVLTGIRIQFLEFSYFAIFWKKNINTRFFYTFSLNKRNNARDVHTCTSPVENSSLEEEEAWKAQRVVN